MIPWTHPSRRGWELAHWVGDDAPKVELREPFAARNVRVKDAECCRCCKRNKSDLVHVERALRDSESRDGHHEAFDNVLNGTL